MAAKKKAAKKKAAPKKPMTKSQIITAIAEDTELSKKQVQGVFDSMAGIMKKQLAARGPQVFTIPGMVKLTVRKKPAVKARKGINPFTGEEMMFKAKPASKVVKATVLKAVKDMV